MSENARETPKAVRVYAQVLVDNYYPDKQIALLEKQFREALQPIAEGATIEVEAVLWIERDGQMESMDVLSNWNE